MPEASGNKKLWIVIGTRPNFVKVTQFRKVATANFPDIDIKIVHTGQHYDEKMAGVFFDRFGLRPDVFLDIEPGHPGLQIAAAMAGLTRLFTEEKPDLVMVVGDVNSTLAGAVAANKCGIPAAHLESGLRSRDLGMPEERNRKVADVLCDLHFITEDSGLANLRAEGISEKGLAFTGNTMIDTLVAFAEDIDQSPVLDTLGVAPGSYALATIHRPSNVDPLPGLVLTEPQGYFDFQKLIAESVFVITDSGGIQEETTFLQKPCLTLRPNTERPSTIEIGTNTLLDFDVDAIVRVADSISDGTYKRGEVPRLWDGNASHRVLSRISDFFENGY
ncbi:MAG: UDP-N-acetyl glucosamine 2-epimerase [Flavobacteriales bacterium]|nr:UDP-N-acetyl glucosamine 2-epimerase [Flavobacteriales bacterium]